MDKADAFKLTQLHQQGAEHGINLRRLHPVHVRGRHRLSRKGTVLQKDLCSVPDLMPEGQPQEPAFPVAVVVLAGKAVQPFPDPLPVRYGMILFLPGYSCQFLNWISVM